MRLSEFLSQSPLYDDLSGSDIDTLEQIMMVRDYHDGHQFFGERSRAESVYLLMSGEVSVTARGRGSRGAAEIKRMKPGELFGLVALIGHERRSASCRAVGPVTAASLPRSAFDLLFESNSPLPQHFRLVVARQLARDTRSLLDELRREIFSQAQSA
jgi:CRP-like cAMP-binding protein